MPTVLICEDNPIIALMLEGLVEDFGHTSGGIAASATDALALCDGQDVAMAVVDLELRDGPTGLGLVGALADRGIASVILSGQSRFLDREHRAVAVLEKPVDERALQALLDGIAATARGGGAPPPVTPPVTPPGR